MDNLQWQKQARGVAWADLIVTSLGLLLIIAIAVVLATNSDLLGNDEEVNWVMWGTIGVTVIFIAIQPWATILLFMATELGREPTDAARKATIWQIVTVIFLIMSVVAGLLSWQLLSIFFSLLVRGGLLCKVHNFIEELNLSHNQPSALMSGSSSSSIQSI